MGITGEMEVKLTHLTNKQIMEEAKSRGCICEYDDDCFLTWNPGCTVHVKNGKFLRVERNYENE